MSNPGTNEEFEAVGTKAEEAFARGELDEALKLLRAALFQFETRIKPAQRADVYVRLGRLKAVQRDARQARNMYEKALVLDLAHRGALEGLVDLFTAEDDAEKLVDAKRKLAEVLAGEERIRQLIEAGDLCAARLKDVPRAVLLYQEALSADPEHRMAQLKLLGTCRDAEMWPDAIAACEQILSVERDQKKRITWHYFLATTYRDKVGDEEKAVAEFEKILDDDPNDAESLAAIEELLVENRDWAGLEGAWTRMLARLRPAGVATQRETLLDKLGENARLQLADLPKAAEYHRQALEVNPEQRSRRELLAGLYAQIPDRWAEAIREHQRLLRGDPKRIDSYHQMRGILRDAGRVDEVWCICAALVHLDRADATERQFYDSYRPKGALQFPGGVNAESWTGDLYHPDEDRAVARLCEALAPVLARMLAQSQKAFGLRPKDRQDPKTSVLALAKALRQASSALDVTLPELFVVPHQPGGLIFAVTDPPASVAAQDFLAGLTPAELRFVAGHHVAAYRREHYAAYLVAAAAAKERRPLAAMFQAYVDAAVALGAQQAVADPTDAVRRVTKALRAQLKPADMESLGLAAHVLAEHPSRDAAAWLRASDLTSDRAALLLCADFPLAAKMVSRVPALSPELTENLRLDELLVFSVSDEHFRLRRALGIALSGE